MRRWISAGFLLVHRLQRWSINRSTDDGPTSNRHWASMDFRDLPLNTKSNLRRTKVPLSDMIICRGNILLCWWKMTIVMTISGHKDIYDNIAPPLPPRIWKGVSATLQSGRCTLSYPGRRYLNRTIITNPSKFNLQTSRWHLHREVTWKL